MRAVDTNVLVRLIVADDQEQAARAKNFIGNGAWVSHLVLVEVVWVLASFYSLDHDKLVQTVEIILSNKLLTVQDRDVASEALSLFRVHKGVDFSDCLILTTARKHGNIPLGTFDEKLSRLIGASKI